MASSESQPISKSQHQRQQRILELLQRDGYVRVPALSRLFEVAEITIRRDLSLMEARELLERTHGGAISVKHIHHEVNYSSRSDLALESKDRIARRAAALIEEGDTVFINGGSTTFHLFRYIKAANVKIVTINAGVLGQLDNPGVDLILAGGHFYPESNAFYGGFTNEILNQIIANKAILGVHGISRRYGLTTPMSYAAETSRIMIERTRGSVIVTADHRKLGLVSDFVTAPAEKIDTLITDFFPDDEYIKDFEELGINVYQTGPAQTVADPGPHEEP